MDKKRAKQQLKSRWEELFPSGTRKLILQHLERALKISLEEKK